MRVYWKGEYIDFRHSQLKTNNKIIKCRFQDYTISTASFQGVNSSEIPNVGWFLAILIVDSKHISDVISKKNNNKK